MGRSRVAAATLLVVGCNSGRDLAPIRLESMETFGADSGRGVIVTNPRVSPHHPGGFRIVISAASGVPAIPLIYGDDGHFLGALHGGTDAGQQFQVPLFTRFGPGDSLWVFDGAGRVLVFDPDRRFARATPLPASPWDALVLRDSRMVIAPANADRPLPLLLVSARGEVVREIGASDTQGVALQAPRWVLRGADGTFWSMPTQFRWRLEHWDSTGSLLAVMDRQPAWFPAYSRLTSPSRDRAPQPALQGVWLDSAGRLWVLGIVADLHWAVGLAPGRPDQPGGVILDPDNVFDTVLEVFDLASGRVVATARVDPSYSKEVEPGVIVRFRERRDGSKRVELVKVIFDSAQAKGPHS